MDSAIIFVIRLNSEIIALILVKFLTLQNVKIRLKIFEFEKLSLTELYLEDSYK